MFLLDPYTEKVIFPLLANVLMVVNFTCDTLIASSNSIFNFRDVVEPYNQNPTLLAVDVMKLYVPEIASVPPEP